MVSCFVVTTKLHLYLCILKSLKRGSDIKDQLRKNNSTAEQQNSFISATLQSNAVMRVFWNFYQLEIKVMKNNKNEFWSRDRCRVSWQNEYNFKKSDFKIFNITIIIDKFSRHIKETLTLTAGNFQWDVFSNGRERLGCCHLRHWHGIQ
jgi:ABC-type multidrug transport system fused ATPase/permease subunit